MYLRDEQNDLLAVAIEAHDQELEARSQATRSFVAAVEAGVPQTQLAQATGIPRATLIRRLTKGRKGVGA
jgi:hypothetical protein